MKYNTKKVEQSRWHQTMERFREIITQLSKDNRSFQNKRIDKGFYAFIFQH